MINSTILEYIKSAEKGFNLISEERKLILAELAAYISNNIKGNRLTELNYICTHNSRRSHLGQVWAQVAASYFGINNLKTYSGGTEATAFNQNAINALKKVGFKIESDGKDKNPKYSVFFGESEPVITCFSKVYNDEANPKNGFCAIMTCSDADENCPLILGAEKRIATTYDDPKAFDNTPLMESKYDERCLQIATETLYAFSLVNK